MIEPVSITLALALGIAVGLLIAHATAMRGRVLIATPVTVRELEASSEPDAEVEPTT
jgi:hypothetical protein